MPPETAERSTDGGSLPGRMLLYVPSANGGIAHYAHYQAEELTRRGVQVTMLCSAAYPWVQDQVSYRQLRHLPAIVGTSRNARVRRFLVGIGGHWRLAWAIVRQRQKTVLLDANTEYFAFLWIWPHLLLRLLGVRYFANFHDPVRKVRYGLPWLHKLELGSFYATLRGGLIHGAPPPGAWLPRWLCLEVVPHGPFPHQALTPPAFDLRERLGIAPERFVLLSFGLITDYKNLDLLIAALPGVPEVDLVIAGKVKSAAERPVSCYRDAAALHGVADRLHIIESFIPEDEVAAYFQAADAVALTYRRDFVSQSGVLQLAVLWEKPILASSGDGPLREVVCNYGIGTFVEPDSIAAITEGLQALVQGPGVGAAAFARYNKASSWEANIAGLGRLLARRDRQASI